MLIYIYYFDEIYTYIAKSSKKPFPNEFGKSFVVLKRFDKKHKALDIFSQEF